MLAKQVLEIGTASVQNYIKLAKDWFNVDFTRYNLHLMPIGFIIPPHNAEAIIVSKDEHKLIRYLSDIINATDVDVADPYQVALTINLRLKRSSSESSMKVLVTDDPDATKVYISEEDIRKTYPWEYSELTHRLKERYSDFKQNSNYYKIKRPLSKDIAYCRPRYLDPGNPKSARKDFYNPNIIKEFDKHFTKKSV
jgi:hypothetical protein